MDSKTAKEIREFLLTGKYPDVFDKHQRYILRRRASNFCITDNELYYIRHRGTEKECKVKVVCSAAEADALFVEFHSSGIGAHCGQIKTRDAISQRFYWPGMSGDIEKWVSQCTVCQKNKRDIKASTEYKPIKTKVPFELVGMDLIGKLVKTEQNHQYICVIIDYCTRWTQAYALKSKSAEEVTQSILKFVYQFEVPKRILTDQGREFVNAINSQVCEVLGIRRSLCAPYHPQTNGLVERLNGTIQRALGKMVDEKPNNWDLYLDAVMFGLRTKKQLTTRFSPFFLMFGREARYPAEVPEDYQVDATVENVLSEELVAIDIERHDRILNIVQENVEGVQERTRKRLQSKLPQQNLQVGDVVLRKNIRSQQRKGGKLDPEFLGPFTITKVAGKSIDLVDSNGKAIHKVNIDHLKLYNEQTPRIPQKLKGHHDVFSIAPPSVTSSPPATVISSPPATVISSPPATVISSPPATVISSPPATVISSPPATVISSPPATANLHPSVISSPLSTVQPAVQPAVTTSPPTSTSSLPVPVTSSPPPVISSPPSGTIFAQTSVSSLEKCVKEAWEGKNVHVLLSKIGPYKLFYWDIANLAPNQQVESEVINAYLKHIVHKKNQEHGGKQALYIDSFEMTGMWQGKNTKLKCDPNNFQVILGAVNEPNHWILTAFFPQQKRSLVLDSLGNASTKLVTCERTARAFMRKRGCEVSTWTTETVPHALQTDAMSCGVFVLKYAENILAEEPLTFTNSKSAVQTYRWEVAMTLLKETGKILVLTNNSIFDKVSMCNENLIITICNYYCILIR
ncbi:gypsy retrotransposon integrase-like protein 1 [Astyanax mexicanus]|uniref:gypsy retrotransposon integrase-like protein 1 n=1 Tax=Astyanax mexicanus TaxID=7994 RepID=UPI0020CB44CA|nr:gypsy retrotransposon integrase-like protein 1 [Astyanax mexicanus]